MKSFGEGHGLECENCLSVDWGSPTLFSGKVSEIPIGQQEPQWRVDAGVGIGIESAYSSSADACSVSEFGNGCSPKSSISASIDSSSKSASKVHLNFQSPRGISRDPSKKKEFIRVEDPRNSLVVVPADGRNEHMIGLKLGKRTYFEDVCAGINIKSSSSSSSSMPTTNTPVKKLKMPQQGSQTTYCQVEGCNVDLAAAKDYHRKHRVCETHSKCPKVIVAGQERRFCQQCSRFHQLSEFDQKKRSCRRRLADHNARRRKPQPEMISFHSARLFSSCYEKYEMNLLSDRELYCHTRPNTNWTRGTSWDLKLNQTKEPWSKPPKTGGFEGQLHFPGIGMSNTTSAPRNDLDKLLLFKGTTAEVLNQGLEASAVASNLAGAPDLRRALSLLSTDTWGSADPGSFSLLPLVNKNLTCTDQPSVQAIRSAVDIWQDEQPVAQQARASSFNLHANGGQFHEFQQLKTPYEADFFDSSQIN